MQLVQDDEQIRIVPIAIFLIIFGAHVNISCGAKCTKGAAPDAIYSQITQAQGSQAMKQD